MESPSIPTKVLEKLRQIMKENFLLAMYEEDDRVVVIDGESYYEMFSIDDNNCKVIYSNNVGKLTPAKTMTYDKFIDLIANYIRD